MIYIKKADPDVVAASIENHFGKDSCFKVSEEVMFIKTEELLSSVLDVAGFDKEKKHEGIVSEVSSMNGWYNVNLWDWEKR